jgi:hypothetical protein
MTGARLWAPLHEPDLRFSAVAASLSENTLKHLCQTASSEAAPRSSQLVASASSRMRPPWACLPAFRDDPGRSDHFPMFLFRASRLGRMGPLGLALTGYQLWRRLSPAQKAAMRSRAQGFVGRLRGGAAPAPPLAPPAHSSPAVGPVSTSSASTVGAATAPSEEIAPTNLTSPGTIADPDLEQQRAEQAFEREKESRASDETKFEELRREQEAERHDRAKTIGEPPG